MIISLRFHVFGENFVVHSRRIVAFCQRRWRRRIFIASRMFLCKQAGITQTFMNINAVDSSLRVSDVIDQLDDTEEGSLNAFVRGITSSSIMSSPFVLAPLFDYLEESFEFCDEEAANGVGKLPVMICGYPSDTDDESKPPEHIPACVNLRVHCSTDGSRAL